MNGSKKFITLIAILALAVGAMAQGGGGRQGFGRNGGGGPTSLLNRDDVKDELKLSDDQKGKIADTMDKARTRGREAFQSAGIQFGPNMSEDDRTKIAKLMAEQTAITEKEISAILTPEQTKRLRELFVQRTGNGVATNPDFAKDLGITDEQKSKIADLQKKQQTAMQDLMQKVRDGDMDRSAMQEAMQKNQAIMNEEIGKILTDDQKAKIKGWSGAPFTFKDNPGGF